MEFQKLMDLKEIVRSTHNSQDAKKNTHTYNTFLMTRMMLPKFVSRQNEKVRVAEKSLTDGDD